MKLTSKLLKQMIREAFEAPKQSRWYVSKKEEDLNQIINEEFSQLLSERASDQEYHDFIEFLFWVFENRHNWVIAKKKTDGWNKTEGYHF